MEIEIPGYRQVRLIAQGGMASVYLAVQESLNRHVALKLLRKRDSCAETERFINEGRIISSLNHRNIITIYDIGLVGERPYISMEFLTGGDLQHRIEAGIEANTALGIVKTIAECLDFVHGRGIVHRDIKPANILFHQDGTPILTDFGIAKELQTNSSLTLDGTALGSPDYLSPEQAQGKPTSGRADIYSLGVVLYEMLAGERPYRGSSPVEVMLAHLAEPVPQLCGENRRHQKLINRMMAKKPEERFGSARELLAYIEGSEEERFPSTETSVLRGLSPDKSVGNPRTNPGRSWGLAAACAVAAALGLATAAIPRAPTVAESTIISPPDGMPAAARATSFQAKQHSVTEIAATLGTPVAKTGESERTLDDARQEKLDQFLSSANAALADYRLTTPRGNNAHSYLRRALELAPDNQEAKQGVTDVANAYADLVEGALDRFAYSEAKRYLSRGLAVQPDNRRLLDLRQRTDAFRDAPTRLVKKIKAWF